MENPLEERILTSSNSSKEDPVIEGEVAGPSKPVPGIPRKCPLCNSLVKGFFIDLHTIFVMCENVECEYPAGEEYPDRFIQDIKNPNFELLSYEGYKAWLLTTKSSESVSDESESDMDKIHQEIETVIEQLYESMNNETERTMKPNERQNDNPRKNKFTKTSNPKVVKSRKRLEDERDIQESVAKIKQYNKVLYEDNAHEYIRNEKWIKNLHSMQTSSGITLLNEHEMQTLKNQKIQESIGELKIDIEAKNDLMPSIKIQIDEKKSANTGAKSNNKP